MKTRKKLNAFTAANLAAVLEVAAIKFDRALKEFKQWPKTRFNGWTWEIVPGELSDSFTPSDMKRIKRYIAKLRQMIQRDAHACNVAPSIRKRTLNGLLSYTNRERYTTAHLEGVFLAFHLAERLVEDDPIGSLIEETIFELHQGLMFSIEVDAELAKLMAPRRQSPSHAR